MHTFPELREQPAGADLAALLNTSSHALCPVCDCSGFERPCWCCGYEGTQGWLPSANHVVQHQVTPTQWHVYLARLGVRAKRRAAGLYVE